MTALLKRKKKRLLPFCANTINCLNNIHLAKQIKTNSFPQTLMTRNCQTKVGSQTTTQLEFGLELSQKLITTRKAFAPFRRRILNKEFIRRMKKNKNIPFLEHTVHVHCLHLPLKEANEATVATQQEVISVFC
ncbi:hypothetical protein CDAR_434281 [Caerostris darwini]|uniref:Ribosomal protein S10 n=1 Tax=Caerostris darwini TaxID=1538125 RepID=A0AAV4UA23_9ARAC|nr:hypothetical protein CDAR_434281 [Caerostris darwini]